MKPISIIIIGAKKMWLKQVMGHTGELVTTTLLKGHSTNPTLKNLLVVSQTEEVITITSSDIQGVCLSWASVGLAHAVTTTVSPCGRLLCLESSFTTVIHCLWLLQSFCSLSNGSWALGNRDWYTCSIYLHIDELWVSGFITIWLKNKKLLWLHTPVDSHTPKSA